jgi:cytochrome c-type biogenesis protein CcmE
MSLLPRSRKARRRLLVVAAAAPILVLAAGLTLWGLRGSISYFYTPAQALKAHVPPGRQIELGGMVGAGSVVKRPDGEVDFSVTDGAATTRVVYRGDLPDLFREGQGVVALGAYDGAGDFIANKDGVLAKHDEKYMPRELTRALKRSGEWRGGGAAGAYPHAGAKP